MQNQSSDRGSLVEVCNEAAVLACAQVSVHRQEVLLCEHTSSVLLQISVNVSWESELRGVDLHARKHRDVAC